MRVVVAVRHLRHIVVGHVTLTRPEQVVREAVRSSRDRVNAQAGAGSVDEAGVRRPDRVTCRDVAATQGFSNGQGARSSLVARVGRREASDGQREHGTGGVLGVRDQGVVARYGIEHNRRTRRQVRTASRRESV